MEFEVGNLTEQLTVTHVFIRSIYPPKCIRSPQSDYKYMGNLIWPFSQLPLLHPKPPKSPNPPTATMFTPCPLLLHRHGHRHLKHLSTTTTTTTTTTRVPLDLPLSHPTFLVWASNTSLGKTLVSAGLAASCLLSKSHSTPRKFLYLKPIQTGFPSDSDSSFVFRKLSHLSLRRHPVFPLFSSNHVLKASVPAANAVLGQGNAENCESGIRNLRWYEERRVEGEGASAAASELVCKTLYAWREAVSPHLVAQRESAVVEDAAVLRELLKCLRVEFEGGRDERKEMDVFCVVETAGGVASPGPSGSLQCDLYR